MLRKAMAPKVRVPHQLERPEAHDGFHINIFGASDGLADAATESSAHVHIHNVAECVVAQHILAR